MALKLRPTGLGHGVYKDVLDYSIFCGEWCIGRIYETRTGPADLRWFWALHAPSKPRGYVPTAARRRWTRLRPSGRLGRAWRSGVVYVSMALEASWKFA